jgi:peptide/nickel transport system permease protein
VVLVCLAAGFGAVIGALAGYFGGWIDSLLMRISDMVFAFPSIILAMGIAASLGASLQNAVIAAALVTWPLYARVVRSLVLSYRHREFVIASRLLGAGSLRVLGRDITPNVVGQTFVLAALEIGNSILLLSGLSFLGLGAQPPAAEWGIMVSDGTRFFVYWWMAVFPGLAIFMVVLSVNLLSDAMRDRLDPKIARSAR